MGDEDNVDKVEEEDGGVVTLAWWRSNTGGVECVGQVKKEGKSVKLGGGRTSVDIGSLVVSSSNRWRGLVVSASKPSDDGLLVWVSKPGVDGLVG